MLDVAPFEKQRKEKCTMQSAIAFDHTPAEAMLLIESTCKPAGSTGNGMMVPAVAMLKSTNPISPTGKPGFFGNDR